MKSETIALCGTKRKLEEEELSAAAVRHTRQQYLFTQFRILWT
jgi:hypothetical protein